MENIKKYQVQLLFILLMVFVSCSKEENTQKIEPEIFWTNPYDISYGTLLSDNQLNANANVSGIFEYTPSIGTRLPEGENQVLEVTFTPNDNAYVIVTKTVKINVISSTIEDMDGNVYAVITIGSQIWMAENLKTTKYRNGDLIPNMENEIDWRNANNGTYCWYNNDKTSNANDYGALYNGFAVLDNRKIAPLGWRVPTVADFDTLIDYLGGVSVAGGKMKSPTTLLWSFPNTDASNESRFSAKPGGICCYPDEYFSHKNNECYFWTSDISSSNLWFLKLSHNTSAAGWGNSARFMGLSVRCVRDN